MKKFLQPNLSLLMDSKPGGSIHDLGKLIYMKMHDRHWEIRDTALELLQICTEIAYISKSFLCAHFALILYCCVGCNLMITNALKFDPGV